LPDATVSAEWRGVRVRYPFAKGDAVGPVDLAIRRGERVLLLGPSGSGKSTLLLTLTGLVPRSIPAQVDGPVSLFGTDASSRQPWAWATQVAQYFQDADQTLCGMRVEDEIAFALENRAMPPAAIESAVAAAMTRVGLPDHWRKRRTSTLSGGERQLAALAAVLVQDASLFVADEPTAHLAPAAASRLHALLMENDPDGSVLIVDHRLDGLIRSIDRMVVLGRHGEIVAEGEPRTVFREKRDLFITHGIWSPVVADLDASLEKAGLTPPEPPLTVAEALAHLDPARAPFQDIERARPVVEAFVAARSAPAADTDAPVLARLSAADCAPFLGPTVLNGIDLAIHEGETLGILGANGAGKSTLGACLSGLLPLKSGKRTGPPGGFAFQRPENQFIAGSVREELISALPKRMAETERSDRVAQALATWGLSGLDHQHPFELSQGQKRRLALASLTIGRKWPLLVLDEPMAGLDARGTAALVQNVLSLREQGCAVAIISHDMDLALRLCTRSIIVGEGRLLADGPTEELLSDPVLLKRSGLAEPSCAPARRWLEQVPC
jgi:energy-coupling factor transport system ATP-binding protein